MKLTKLVLELLTGTFKKKNNENVPRWKLCNIGELLCL
jgi:hypothetical protein